MHRLTRVAALAAAALLAAGTPGVARAQTSMTVSCAPGVGCSQLRFDLTSTDALMLNNLTLGISGGGVWRFLEPSVPGIGTYSAVDDVGAFGGFTTISDGGSELFIDFLEGGFLFELAAAGTGYVQVEGTSDETGGVIFDYRGMLEGGGTISGRAVFGNQPPDPPSVVPEPATVLLLGTGLAGVALVARRRRRTTLA